MSGLLDFLQAASNSVAGNVTGPVDLITLALRKAGLPVPEDSVGTSAWAKQKGLMRDVAPGAARVAGETAGILGPMLATHYAPQIAGGLLKANENLAAPTTLRPEAGAIVWHGSPHKFDKFDSSRIGTGEGAQAYGHGLYVAESPETAKSYAVALARPSLNANIAGRQIVFNPGSARGAEQFAVSMLNATKGDRLKAIKLVEAHKHLNGLYANKEWLADQIIDVLKNNEIKLSMFDKGSNLYKIDLPDDAIARMLDWDKPLKTNQETYAPILKELGYLRKNDNGPRQYANAVKSLGMEKGGFGEKSADVGGQVLWKKLVDKHGSPNKAADWLKSQGIPGIRYLDGMSRSAGEGSRNFVIFPGNEDLLTILERNGVPIR